MSTPKLSKLQILLKYLDKHKWQGRMFFFFLGLSMCIVSYKGSCDVLLGLL